MISFLLNVTASRGTAPDWTIQDAYADGVLLRSKPLPKEVDLNVHGGTSPQSKLGFAELKADLV